MMEVSTTTSHWLPAIALTFAAWSNEEGERKPQEVAVSTPQCFSALARSTSV